VEVLVSRILTFPEIPKIFWFKFPKVQIFTHLHTHLPQTMVPAVSVVSDGVSSGNCW